RFGSLLHALAKRARKVGLTPFEKEFHIANRFEIGLRRCESFHTRSQAAPDVVLKTWPRVITVQVHIAGGNQKSSMNKVNDSVRQVPRKIRPVVGTSVLLQTPRYIYPWKALAQRQLDIGIGLVVAQQNVEARLALLDQVVFERQRFFVVG